MPAPRRLSDVASRSQLERNRAYVEVLRPSGARHQLTVLASPISLRSTRGWAISRIGSDFPEEALDQARALQPMLALLDRTFDGGSAGGDGGAAAERAGLTSREIEVLRLVAEGLTSHAIGRRLRISPRTVDKHRENIHRKLDRFDRLSVVQRAQELGIVSVPRRGPDRPLTTAATRNCVQRKVAAACHDPMAVRGGHGGRPCRRRRSPRPYPRRGLRVAVPR